MSCDFYISQENKRELLTAVKRYVTDSVVSAGGQEFHLQAGLSNGEKGGEKRANRNAAST